MPGDATPIVDDLPAVPSTSLPSAKKVSPAKKVAADVGVTVGSEILGTVFLARAREHRSCEDLATRQVPSAQR